jgi:hypothetical protein
VRQQKINFYLPLIWEEITDATDFYGWKFLRPLIGKKIFWASVDWVNCRQKDLPPGYAAYVIKTEGPNVEWAEQQAQLVDAPIFYCCLPKDYGTFDHLPNVHFVPVIEWHYQFEIMSQVYGATVNKTINHKVSALCHRGTQSKIVVLSALAQHIGLEQCLVSLHNIRDDEVHHWQPTKNHIIDQHTQYFIENFLDKTIKIDQFSNKDLTQVHDFHHPAYENSAININNESFHYSYMHTTDQKERINPGPFITEKTLKCLLAETAFINNGQFDVYATLTSLGFEFDYGLDLNYDSDSGNLSRLAGVLELIKSLSQYSSEELYLRTRHSCLHNKEHIMSGKFYKLAQAVNDQATETILEKL